MSQHNFETPRSLKEAFGSHTSKDLYLPAPHPFTQREGFVTKLVKGIRRVTNEAFKKG